MPVWYIEKGIIPKYDIVTSLSASYTIVKEINISMLDINA